MVMVLMLHEQRFLEHYYFAVSMAALYLRTLRKGIVGRVRRSIDEMLVFIDEDFEKRVLCLLVTDEFIGMQVIEFSSCVRLLLMRW